MSRVVTPIVCLLALAAAGLLFRRFVLDEGGGARGPERPPPAPASARLPEQARRRLESAPAREAPAVYRELYAQHTATRARRELAALFQQRSERAQKELDRESEELLDALRYRSAVDLAERYRRAWAGTPVATHAGEIVKEVRREQADQVQARISEATRLLETERYEAAREALRTGWELETRYRTTLEERSAALERRIRSRQAGAATAPPPGPPPQREVPATARREPPAPPALPGYPHPDVKRRAEAKELLGNARRLFDNRRYQPAAKALADVVGYFGDLRFVEKRRDGIEALAALARHGTRGLAGLFHATSIKRKGRQVTLRYTFAAASEQLDWEEEQIIPNQEGGAFEPARGGVRGTGVATYLLRAFFESHVSIRCRAKIQRAKSHGLVFCQNERETRFLMWMVANDFFVEGENYVKVRPGHSILMFGKGVNADVPVDAPDTGFIFRGPSITRPELRDGAEVDLSFSFEGKQMSGEVEYRGARGGRRGSTIGDDGRGIDRVRPGLFVIGNRVLFREIVVEGRLHADFEKRRVSTLLDLAAMLDEE